METASDNNANYLVTYQAQAGSEGVCGRTFAYFECDPPRAQDILELETNIQVVTGYNSVFITGFYKLTVEED